MKQKIYGLLSLCLVLSLASCCKSCKKNKLETTVVDKEIVLENNIISKAATEQEIVIVEDEVLEKNTIK